MLGGKMYKKRIRFCEQCGSEMLGNASRKFCDSCRKERKKESDKKTREKHLMEHTEKNKREMQEQRLRGKELARKLNDNSLKDFCNKKIDAKLVVSFSIPFKTGMSKNFYLGIRHGGYGVYKKLEARTQEDLIVSKLQEGVFRQNKVWLDFYVEKPTNRSDAVNVVDLVCDAVKKGIGVDDRWFSLGQVDWQVVKDREPQVYIKIYQEDVWDARVCALCGRILPEACFGNKKNNNCKECSRKKYEFTEEDLEEMISNTSVPLVCYKNGKHELSPEDERLVQKWLVCQRIYGDKFES